MLLVKKKFAVSYRHFAKASEEETEEECFYLYGLVNTKTKYPPQGRWRAVDIYLDASHLDIISTTIHLPFFIYLQWIALFTLWKPGFCDSF